MGLRWISVDLGRGTLSVRQQLTREAGALALTDEIYLLSQPSASALLRILFCRTEAFDGFGYRPPIDYL